ncbi:MAG: hypothetical protein II328_00700, partial [Clostridia bacterium]|nr:hypothetical protein [Clostridia bacterium]
MIRKLLPYIGKYKKETVLTPLMIVGEVLMEILIPFLMAKIIDEGIPGNDIPYITILGACMIGMALISLVFGALGGKYAAVSGSGFAANLRKAEFERVQAFSFANVKFLKSLLRLAPEKIVYVSCNPDTLGRDAITLRKGGYRVERVTPVDMFPFTTHV